MKEMDPIEELKHYAQQYDLATELVKRLKQRITQKHGKKFDALSHIPYFRASKMLE